MLSIWSGPKFCHVGKGQVTIVKTMDRGGTGMNAVTITTIYPRKEFCPSQGSRQQPLLKSCMLPTELHWQGTPDKKSLDLSTLTPLFL